MERAAAAAVREGNGEVFLGRSSPPASQCRRRESECRSFASVGASTSPKAGDAFAPRRRPHVRWLSVAMLGRRG
ncbi:unnamed protein product [Lampetra planeri]